MGGWIPRGLTATRLGLRAEALWLAAGCVDPAPEPLPSNPSGCASAADTGDWVTAAQERCVPGQVVERLHEIPEDAPPGMEGPPMAGVTVGEYGQAGSADSDADGRFVLQLVDPDLLGVAGGAEGFVSRAFAWTWASFERSRPGIEVDLPEEGHELELCEEVFGTPWTPTRSAVYVHFYNPDELMMWGASATLSAGAAPMVYVAPEELAPGHQVPELSPDPQVLFADVAPGDATLTTEPPPGMTCHAPAVVPVLPDVMIDVLVTCMPD